MKVSFIGLGAMGFPMARHLKKDHEVTVWNRTTAIAEKHSKEHGTTLANSLADCASAEVVITILPTSREVDVIVDELLPRLQTGTLWIDATSGDPGSSRKTAARLAEHGVAFVDAPVSGGPVGAEAATLTVMVGGSDEAFKRAEEVLVSCAKKIIHVGDVGAGDTIKAITNTVMAANLWVASEAMVALQQAGFDRKTGLDVLNGSSGRSNVSENLLPQRLVKGEWPLLFKLALLDKDVRIASDILREQRTITPMIALTEQFMGAARKELGEQADYIEVAKYVAAMSGQKFD
jgi:3-hydroxyisobutyrate dehydrogenase